MVNKRRRVGFTIVELVIVIAVIAVLAAILIPTFVSITKKANLSADMVAVREMNGILAAEEITDGKPATVVDAKAVLNANGVNDFTPMSANSEFYWLGSDNRVILWEWENDEKTAGEVTYPDEYKKMYSDVIEPSSAWSLLDQDTQITLVDVSNAADIENDLIEIISNATDGEIVRLSSSCSIDISMLTNQLENALSYADGVGKKITIDFNGSNITMKEYSLSVPKNGELVILNGNFNGSNYREGNSIYTMFKAESGAKLVIRNVIINTDGSGIMPAGDASEVVVDNSKITANCYAVGTNRLASSNIRVSILNSELTATGTTAFMVNTPSYTFIKNSVIKGVTHAVIARAGTVKIESSVLSASDTEPGAYSYKKFNYGHPNWLGGNAMAASTLLMGDYGQGSTYSGDVVCTLINTKLESADNNLVPEVVMAAELSEKLTSLSYDEASTVGRIVIYGEDFEYASGEKIITHYGTIKVNETGQLRYTISSEFGTFAAGSELNAADLNTTYTDQGYDYGANIKAYLIEKYDTFDSYTDVEWEKLNLWFSSGTNGDLKGYYDESGNTVALTRENLITKGIISGDCPVKLLNRVNFASLKKETTVRNCLNELKLYCEKIGLEITEEQWSNVKIVIGETNTIVDIVVE